MSEANGIKDEKLDSNVKQQVISAVVGFGGFVKMYFASFHGFFF